MEQGRQQMAVTSIAAIVHEANRAYCRTIGDDSQEPWTMAPEWQVESAIKGVKGILDGTITRPEQSHESWLVEKERTGWKFGPVKDAKKKEHPCFVPYAELPPEQQVKDAIFFAIVRACSGVVPAAPSQTNEAAQEATVPELRTDGPTIEEYVTAGYPAYRYPPPGYASVPSAGLDVYRALVEGWKPAMPAVQPDEDEPAAPKVARCDCTQGNRPHVHTEDGIREMTAEELA